MEKRLREIVRQFPENGVKLLLERPANVRDLLRITGADIVEQIDFAALKTVKTHFVGRDYRHAESDIVLRAPFGPQGSGGSSRSILLYILIEHQSEPDRGMPLRLLEYMLGIYKLQEREARREPRSPERRLYPVLPVVFYTGVRAWETPGSLVDLVEMGEIFTEFTPKFRPLFVNLPATSASTLTSRGGFFGWVLSLLRARRSNPRVFERLLQRVVERLEAMPAQDRDRWRELLSYVHAMVYHYREEDEIAHLQKRIETSARGADEKQEIVTMGRTGAEALMARGREEGQITALRDTLLRQLAQRFGTLSEAVVNVVENTSDRPDLEAWLDRVLTAKTLDDVGIADSGD